MGSSKRPISPANVSFAGLVIVTMVALAGCNQGKSASTAAAQAPEVGVASVISRPVQEWDEFNGRIEAIDNAQVRPRISGYIERIAFKEGDVVKQGDLLFEIDPRPYRNALASAQAQLEHARATAELARTQNKRAQVLVDAKAISREEADTRSTNVSQSEANVRAALAEVATAKLNLDFTQVRSPVSGRAGRAMLTVGNLAQAELSVLTSVVSQDPMFVYFDFDEHSYLEYQALARQQGRDGNNYPVHVGVANEDGFRHAGTVDFLNNQLDASTGTIRVRAELPNADRSLTPGLFARVQLAGRGTAQAMLIDDKAVLTDQDRKYVYVVGPDNKALRKEIATGRLIDGLRVVKSGLNSGDNVVVSGMQKIFFPGMPVKPIAASVPAPVDAMQAAAN